MFRIVFILFYCEGLNYLQASLLQMFLELVFILLYSERPMSLTQLGIQSYLLQALLTTIRRLQTLTNAGWGGRTIIYSDCKVLTQAIHKGSLEFLTSWEAMDTVASCIEFYTDLQDNAQIDLVGFPN